MYKKSINWDNLNIEMKLRYQDKINDDDNFLEYISKYHLPNLDWLEDKNIKTNSTFAPKTKQFSSHIS